MSAHLVVCAIPRSHLSPCNPRGRLRITSILPDARNPGPGQYEEPKERLVGYREPYKKGADAVTGHHALGRRLCRAVQ